MFKIFESISIFTPLLDKLASKVEPNIYAEMVLHEKNAKLVRCPAFVVT